MLGRNLFDIDGKDKISIAKSAIDSFEHFFKSIGMPTTFSELGIENPDIDLLVKKVHQNKGEVFGAYYPITPEVSRAIYIKAIG